MKHRSRVTSWPGWGAGFVFVLCCALACAHADEWLNQGKIPRIQIEVGPEAMQVLRGYAWEWGGNDSERTNVSAKVKVAGMVYTNVALHLKGSAGSFRPVDNKPGMTLNFDKWAEGQKFFGLQKIHLNNSVQDPSYACDILAREVFNAAGVPTPRASHAWVTLNDREIGLYVLVEGWNKQFLKRHFKDPKGNLYDGGFARDIHQNLAVNSGDKPEDQTAMQALIEAVKTKGRAARNAKLEKALNVDSFLTFAALEVMLTHNDGYCIGHNNYRVFHDRSIDKMVFLPHGMDQLFGRFRSTPESPLTPGFKSEVSKAVMGTEDGQARFLERVAFLNTNVFQARSLLKRVNQIEAKLRGDWIREGDDAGLDELAAAFRDLRARISRRCISITQQLENPRPPMQFTDQQPVRLEGLGYRADSSRTHQGRRLKNDGKEILAVRAGAGRPRTFGSWRTSLYLPEGHYELSARVRVLKEENVEGIATGLVQAAIRVSGDREQYPVHASPEWKVIRHEFDLSVNAETELVFEVRGVLGEAQFDAESIELRRLGPTREER